MSIPEGTPSLLARWEVAKRLAVNPETVARWGRSGKLRSIVTPGGHRRYFEADVVAILATPGDDTEVHTEIRTEEA